MKMNSCPSKSELIAYRLDMLSPEERKLIEQHIAVCPQCQHALQLEIEIDHDLGTLMDPGYIEDIVIRKLRVYSEMIVRAWWQYPLWIWLNTLAAFAIGFGIWILIVNTRFEYLSWLRTLTTALETDMSSTTIAYIICGLSIAFILANICFAFRKAIARHLV
jgi:hypothetical protein